MQFRGGKATLDISSILAEKKNVAFKIKTTAPKLFVVKPIQGIVAPGSTCTVEVQLQSNNFTSIGDVVKNKFMVQATPCDIQATEQFQLPRFWEEMSSVKDKNILQQMVLRINLADDGRAAVPAESSKSETPMAATSKYENAPPSNINDSIIHKPQSAPANDDLVVELEKVERECSALQQ